jgi:hypothetical protein
MSSIRSVLLILLALCGPVHARSFRPAGSYLVGDGPTGIAVGDFNGDGKVDLVTANGGLDTDLPGVSVLLNNGDGTFQPAATLQIGQCITSLNTGDFDNDSHLDLALVDFCNGVEILFGKGDGTFPGPPLLTCSNCIPVSAAAADMNGDGKLDLVVSGGQQGRKLVRVLLGKGDGNFRSNQAISVSYYNAGLVQVDDFNNDGVLDVAVTLTVSDWPDAYMGIALGNQDGTFRKLSVYSHVEALVNFAIGDVTGDGYDDILFPDGNSKGGKILLGAGDGSFREHLTYQVGQGDGGWVALVDFNGDGILDMAVVGFQTISVLAGLGDGQFNPATRIQVRRGCWAAVAADLNDDNAPDLAVTQPGLDAVSVLLNEP